MIITTLYDLGEAAAVLCDSETEEDILATLLYILRCCFRYNGTEDCFYITLAPDGEVENGNLPEA